MNFKFHNGTNKIYANAPIYNYSYYTFDFLAPIHIIYGVRSRTQTPRTIKFVNLYEDIPREVNKVFANQPLDPRRGGLDPPRPPIPREYFGLPTVNRGKPPLPPNRPYCRPFNYPKYVKDFNLDAHV
jgi:hypothetical protein